MLYLAAIVTANLTAATLVPLPVGLSTTVGTFLFGATFTLRDRLHRRGGRALVYRSITAAAILTAFLCFTTGTGWRILGASVVALVLAELADTEIYARTVGGWWLKVLRSNAVSVPIDTLLFNLLAFGGVWAWPLLLSVSLGDILIKYSIGAGVALWSNSSTVPARTDALRP
jgi:uncharacterized PurR-regulated membrane protein YhhQ (DUF165 family)